MLNIGSHPRRDVYGRGINTERKEDDKAAPSTTMVHAETKESQGCPLSLSPLSRPLPPEA